MSADALLDKLDKVRQTATGKWIACCPAHDDKRPSLAVAEGEDGRVLVKCFAGCAVNDIVGAVGLSLDALFPPKVIDHRIKPLRRPFPAADTLECLGREAEIIWLAGAQMAQGATLDAQTRDRLNIACERVREAVHG